jgi:flagellar biosynthesis/type III secretory pathway protein FliH
MGNNTCDFEKVFACGSQQGLRAGKKNLAEEAYQAGKCLGYNLGYNLGFELGYEKGYTEGSNLGYNNGFVAALRNEESGGGFLPAKGTGNSGFAKTDCRR